MSQNVSFDRTLEAWLDGEAAPVAPSGLHAAAVDQARSAGQRPAWLVTLRGGTIGPAGHTSWRATPQVTYVLLVAALAIALISAAILAASGRIDPSMPPLGRNGAIAYSINDLDQRPYSHIRLMAADGSNDHELAEGSCGTFSADGSQLAYGTGFAGTSGLAMAKADGTEPQAMPIRGALSPDFSRIAWITTETRDENSGAVLEGNEVWLANLDGSQPILVAPKSNQPGEWFESLVWSPDGRGLAFAGLTGATPGVHGYRGAFYIAAADGGGVRLLTNRPGTDSAYVAWSRDGRSLAFDGLPDGSPLPTIIEGVSVLETMYPPEDIFVIRSDGTGERNVTNTPTIGEFGGAWSPDGTHIVFFGGPPLPGDDSARVGSLRMADGAAAGPIVLGPGNNGTVWSPDGKLLLLLRASDTSGSLQTVDPDFSTTPVTLLEADHGISCATWQRLEP